MFLFFEKKWETALKEIIVNPRLMSERMEWRSKGRSEGLVEFYQECSGSSKDKPSIIEMGDKKDSHPSGGFLLTLSSKK